MGNMGRGIWGGGAAPDTRWQSAPSYVATMDYVTISSLGNAQNFGELTVARGFISAVAGPVRGISGGGEGVAPDSARSDTMEYYTIQSAGAAKEFGDLNNAFGYGGAAASNATRALHAGGYVGPANSNVIDYITMATTGNASDFGDLVQAEHGGTGMSSGTRAVFGGMWDGAVTNELSYVTIMTLGNALDFGDQTISAYYRSGGSNTHGGLQG